MAIMEKQLSAESEQVVPPPPTTFTVEVTILTEGGEAIPFLSEAGTLPEGVSVTAKTVTIPSGPYRANFQINPDSPYVFLDPALTFTSDQLARMGVAPTSSATATLGLDNNIPVGGSRQTYAFNLWFKHISTSQALIHDPTIIYEPPGG